MMPPYFWEGSRACTRCGAVVSDPNRETHVAFHERIDPAPIEPDPAEVELIQEPAA